MKRDKILERLFSMRDEGYCEMNARVVNDPTLKYIGVRTPDLRRFASELFRANEYEEFISILPHEYNDEYLLHGFILSKFRDYDRCIEEVERLLPFMSNWAETDTLSPKCFERNREDIRRRIDIWMGSDMPYIRRFALCRLMSLFLDDPYFRESDYGYILNSHMDHYYLNMMRAWYMATALAKQYESAVKIIEDRRLDRWTHNKAIQKAVESFRVSDEKKTYLKSLRWK